VPLQRIAHSWALGTTEHDFCGGGACWDPASGRYYAAVTTKATDGAQPADCSLCEHLGCYPRPSCASMLEKSVHYARGCAFSTEHCSGQCGPVPPYTYSRGCRSLPHRRTCQPVALVLDPRRAAVAAAERRQGPPFGARALSAPRRSLQSARRPANHSVPGWSATAGSSGDRPFAGVCTRSGGDSTAGGPVLGLCGWQHRADQPGWR